jgi:hypothetical protein
MLTYQLREKGQLTKFTTNAKTADGTDSFEIYKIDNNGKLHDITPSDVTIDSLDNGSYKRVKLNVPDEDCYIFSLFNDEPLFLRVGVPTLRIFVYTNGETGLTIDYKLKDFNGDSLDNGTMDEVKDSDSNSNGVYAYVPGDIGDAIFEAYINDEMITAPTPIHVPYVFDTASLRGKIAFEKDKWMLIAVPIKGKRVYDGVVKPLEDKYNVKGEDLFLVFNAYPATIKQSGRFLSFVPGVTSTTSEHNFKLMYEDEDNDGNKIYEITGFWAKTKNYTIDSDDNKIAILEWDATN